MPFTSRPSYHEVARLPLDERIRALADPERRARILAEPWAPGFQRLTKMMDGLNKVWVLGDPPNYEPDPRDSIAARARALGRDPWDFALDVLAEQEDDSVTIASIGFFDNV